MFDVIKWLISISWQRKCQFMLTERNIDLLWTKSFTKFVVGYMGYSATILIRIWGQTNLISTISLHFSEHSSRTHKCKSFYSVDLIFSDIYFQLHIYILGSVNADGIRQCARISFHVITYIHNYQILQQKNFSKHSLSSSSAMFHFVLNIKSSVL